MSLKPINLIQAAKVDLERRARNTSPYRATYEHYAFHRLHVRQAKTVSQLLLLALMSPPLKMVADQGIAEIATVKRNTKLIYENAGLLVDALKLVGDRNASERKRPVSLPDGEVGQEDPARGAHAG